MIDARFAHHATCCHAGRDGGRENEDRYWHGGKYNHYRPEPFRNIPALVSLESTRVTCRIKNNREHERVNKHHIRQPMQLMQVIRGNSIITIEALEYVA